MDWVHCNTCFLQPGSSSKKFFLTSCGHVFCQDCIQGSTGQKCTVCKSSCSVIPLTSNLKPDVEMYFMDPGELLKKQLKPYFQVLEFQKSHRKRLAAHYQKIGATSSESGQSSRRFQEIEREMRKLLEENNAMKKILGAGNGGDPKNRGNSSRPGTPHDMRGISPGQNSQSVRQRGHYNSSTPHGQISPYSRSAPVTPQMINAMKGSQRDTPKTPAGPIRLTVRTPPSNGMIGRIGTPPSGRQRGTPGIVANLLLRAGNTPAAGHESSKTPTLMRTSSRESHSSQARVSDTNNQYSQPMSWSSSQHASQNTSQHQARKHGGSQVDPNRRQIHVRKIISVKRESTRGASSASFQWTPVKTTNQTTEE